MNQNDANRIALDVANFGASLGLSRPACLVQNAPQDWLIVVTCRNPLTGLSIVRKCTVKAESNEEALIGDAGRIQMLSLQANFHTKH